MTGNEGRTAPTGPPWSVDDLADLHAGLFDDEVTARMWREVSADPEARAVLEALEATTIDLAELPPVRMPEAVVGRLDAAIAAETTARQAQQQPAATGQPPQESGQVVDLTKARERRNRKVGWVAGTLTAAAAALAVGLTVLPNLQGSDQQAGDMAAPAPPADQQEEPGAGSPPLALGDTDELDMGKASEAMNSQDYGPLADAGKRNACLAANDASPQRVEGTRQVRIDGTRGVLFVLTTGEKGQFRLLAVGGDCGPGNPAKLGDKTVP